MLSILCRSGVYHTGVTYIWIEWRGLSTPRHTNGTDPTIIFCKNLKILSVWMCKLDIIFQSHQSHLPGHPNAPELHRHQDRSNNHKLSQRICRFVVGSAVWIRYHTPVTPKKTKLHRHQGRSNNDKLSQRIDRLVRIGQFVVGIII